MGASLNLSAQFIDSRRGFSKSFRELLWPEIQLEIEDTALNLTAAFQAQIETVYQLCFIGDSIREDFGPFFADVKTLGREKTCIFVKVVESLAPGAERILAQGADFNVQITRGVTAEDKQVLMTLLGREIRVREVERRSLDVAEVVELLVKQIDEAADEARRGRHKPLHKVVQSIVDLHVQFDHSLLERYFHELTRVTEQSKPVRQVLREVPDLVVAKRLPKLGKGGYVGASSRVFSMLVDRFGDDLASAVQKELSGETGDLAPTTPNETSPDPSDTAALPSESINDEYADSDDVLLEDDPPSDAPE